MQHNYSDPVAKLLDYGRFDLRRIHEPWPNYLELGFSEAHVPELIRMMTDNDLHNAKMDSLEVWAPLHAWRTLGQLHAVEAAEPMVRLFDRLQHDDWLATELPKAFSLIGPASIPAITEFMGDATVDEMCRISAPACLEKIAQDHPNHRDECIGDLERQLGLYETNGPNLNAFIIDSLINLEATETIDTIRKAFFAGCVDLVVLGDVEDVEIAMGLRLTRDTPPPDVPLIPGFPNLNADDGWGFGSDDFLADTAKNILRQVGRNDPCPCGSGKKFKKCCLH
jgi:hypothetical protein